MPSFGNIGNQKPVGCLQLISNVFQKYANFFNLMFFSCLIVTVPLWTRPLYFLVKYKLFCLVSNLSDAVLNFSLSF